MATLVLPILNVLGGETESVERIFSLAVDAPQAGDYALDMRAVTFVRPYGVVALVTLIRHLAKRSGSPVRLLNLDDQVHLYLDRMDFFEGGESWLRPPDELHDKWSRSSQTLNLLEITPIAGPGDVATVISRAQHIFSRWLMVPNLGNLLSALSELCANVYQHSGDPQGSVLIQKYESAMRGQAIVNLAVGDLGQGIRGSLSARHGEIGQEPLDYLREAMRGRTARDTGRGGLGLRRVEQIVESEGGYLWLRSESAAILSRGPQKTQGYRNLALVRGTQVSVELHAPLRI